VGRNTAKCDTVKTANFETLNFYYLNAQSIKEKKRNDFTAFLETSKDDVICVTETWFVQDELPNGVLSDKKYVVHRKDRPGHAGGVALFAKQELKTSAVTLNTYSILI